MTKHLDLETRPSDKSKNEDPLDPKFVDPSDKKRETQFPAISFFQLFRYTESLDKVCIFIGFLCALGTAVCQPLNMLVFGNLTGDMIEFAQNYYVQNSTDITKQEAMDKLEDDIITFVIWNTSLGVVMLILSYLSSLLFNYTGIRQSFKIRKIYLEKVLNQDVSWYDLNTTGDFSSRMADDLIKLEDGLGEKVSMFLHFQMSFFACLIMALVRGWELALICLISLPVTMTAMGVVAYLTSRLAKNEMEAYGIAGAIAEEVLSTIRTVLAFAGEQKEIDRYNKELVFAKNNNIRRGLLAGIGFGILWFGIYASYALAFWYGVGLVIDEQHLPEDQKTYGPRNMVTVFFSVMTGSMNFGMSSPYIEIFGIARGAASKIFGVIDNKPIINESKHKGLKPEKVLGDIVFQDVHFKYPSREEVKILDGLNLKINQGETIALVGSSGCGKSTCVQLLQRFYDPYLGKVTIDGNDLKDLNLVWLRDNIGVVGQEPVLFGTTIAENIRYGFRAATQEQIERAAKKANAHKFIMNLPQGYNTLVGERGAQLSGGQKQRIAIARALVREPAILLLDEATSALDTNSEAKVQAALDNASKECTTIIIAHRLTTIRGAHRIVVIDKGVVVEEGSHQELMSKQGEYYNLVMAQVSPTEDENFEKRLSVNPVDDEDETDKRIFTTQMSVHYDDQEETGQKISLRRIMSLNANEKLQITVGVVASIFMGFAMPIFSVLFGEIIGILQYEDEEYVRSETNLYCIYFVCAGVMAGISTFLQIYMFGVAGEKLVMRVRGKMFESMLRQEIGWYDRKDNGVGALCAKLSSEASNIQGATGQRIGSIFQSVATLCLAVGLSMYYEYRLGLVALCFTPVILAAVFIQQRTMQNEIAGFRQALETSTKLAVEAVGNVRTVVSLGCEETFHKLYVTELVPYLTHARKNIYVRAFVYAFARSIMFFAFSVCNYYGGYLIRNDGMSFEKLLKVSQALIMGTVSIANALAFTPNFQRGLESAAKVFKLLDRIPEIKDTQNASNSAWKTGDIEYSNVHFKYPTRPNTNVLNGLNLSVLNGKTVALVGPSGCGKSTIIQLIERYYDPLNGIVSVDNQDIKEIKMTDLRSHLGIVSQEPNLFDRTIAENIAYGDNSRTVSRAEVVEAAKNANIHKFITTLPLGYDTPLGEKGTQLSGGQKQRVAIARALVRNPKVLLLDEATSALDTESEKVVQEALDNAKQGRTCITIAHRLSTIQDADVICVIQDGKVLELGSHSELLTQRGLYYNLYSLQVRKK